jgi:L-fuconolactonase
MQKMPRIDAHQHFWKYNAKEYDWIDAPMAALRRDFLPANLKVEIDKAGIDGVVSVQARQTLEETRWLLELAGRNAFMRGVVGWVPLTDPRAGSIVEKFAPEPKLKAMRHILQGEADDHYMLRPDFNNGIRALHHYGLTYDILIYEKHLPQTIQFVDQHPGQVFVLDHVAKPKIKEHAISPWRENIRELAKRPNVYCKISGMVTEADWKHWTPQDLQPYIDTVLAAFTPRRIMFGSDWPVCLVASTYTKWHATVVSAIDKLSPAERDRILGGTAMEAYNLAA